MDIKGRPMKNILKKFLMLVLCIPVVMLCSCTKKTPKISVDYYFNNSVETSFFSNTSTRNLKISDLTAKKVNKDLLDCYSIIELDVADDNSRTYHLYIDYITFYVYTNESNENDFNIKIWISNVIDESEVGKEQQSIEPFSETYSGKPVANKSIKFKVDVNKVVATATGCAIRFDLTTCDIYNVADEEVTFKWALYKLEIHAEPRTYN